LIGRTKNHQIEIGMIGLGRMKSSMVRRRTADAETTPLRHPEYYQYDLNLADIAEVWRRGSVIASWLLDLTALTLLGSQDLADLPHRSIPRQGGEHEYPLFPMIHSASVPHLKKVEP